MILSFLFGCYCWILHHCNTAKVMWQLSNKRWRKTLEANLCIISDTHGHLSRTTDSFLTFCVIQFAFYLKASFFITFIFAFVNLFVYYFHFVILQYVNTMSGLKQLPALESVQRNSIFRPYYFIDHHLGRTNVFP
jgi:hypothetical protein